MNQTLAIAEYVARACVPELSGMKLYIVQPSPDGMVTSCMIGGRAGCYVPGLDAMLQPELERQGQWRGSGLAIIVDHESIRRTVPDPFDAERCVIGATLHEIVHWLDTPERPEPPPGTATERYLEFVERCKPAPDYRASIPADFWGHGASFVRIASHVWWRLCHGGGYVMRPDFLGFGAAYEGLETLSRPIAYVTALDSEFEANRDRPLRTLASIAPPAAFVELWKTDEARIYKTAAERAA